MQLYALEGSDPIFAERAVKQKDYLCPECGTVVRLRGGDHRQNHFYHTKEDRVCRQNGKSMVHLQVQLHLHQSLGCELERRFPQINRIADVVWEDNKLIFEIQCSPITANEIAKRNADYQSIGYEVVWILHDKRFNQRRHTGAEHALLNHSHYYTNFDSQGRGIFYDQFDIVQEAKRLARLPKLPILIHKPYRAPSLRNQWHWGFEGDLSQAPSPYLKSMEDLIKKYQLPPRSLLTVLYRPFKILFDYYLEKACR